jgi:hypothetical protein
MEYVIDKNKVTVNGKTIDFPFEIGEAFLIKNMLVVRIEIPLGRKHDENIMTENVYGINSEGELAWRIQKISDAYPRFENTGNLYTVITERANDIMTVVSFEDEVFIVDPCTGEILGKHKKSRF